MQWTFAIADNCPDRRQLLSPCASRKSWKYVKRSDDRAKKIAESPRLKNSSQAGRPWLEQLHALGECVGHFGWTRRFYVCYRKHSSCQWPGSITITDRSQIRMRSYVDETETEPRYESGLNVFDFRARRARN